MGSVRVLHLLDTNQIAGIERHLLQLSSGLARLSVDVVIGCHGGEVLEAEARRLGIGTVPVFSKGGLLMDRIRLGKALQRDEVDIIHAHNGYTMLLAAWASRSNNVTAVATQHFVTVRHEQQYKGLKRYLARKTHRWMNERLTQIVAVSHAAGTAMRKREGIEPGKIVVVPNGVSSSRPLLPAERQATRTAFGIACHALLVVTVARLETEKGISVLLDAIRSVQQSVPEARFLIVGEGRQRAALEAQARHLELMDTVTFTGYREDVAALIGSSDLFVLPSLQESFGLGLVEAMALEVAVIGTRTGGQREVVKEGVNGLLVPPGDAASLAAAITQLLKSPRRRLAMGKAGYARFQSCFTAEQMAQATKHVYEEALGRKRVEVGS